MATVTLNEIYQLRVFTSCDNQLGLNVKNFKVTAVSPLASSEADLCAALSALVAPMYKAIMSADATYNAVTIQKVAPPPKRNFLRNATGVGTGIPIGDVLAKQACGMVTLYTDTIGPGGRGRLYLPFPPEDMNETGGKPTAAYLTGAGVIGDWMTTDQTITTGVTRTVNISFGLLKASGAFLPFTLRLARQRWGTQKSRGSYGKPNI